jgi:hypothetical protein
MLAQAEGQLTDNGVAVPLRDRQEGPQSTARSTFSPRSQDALPTIECCGRLANHQDLVVTLSLQDPELVAAVFRISFLTVN